MSQHNGEQTRLLKYLSLDLAQHFRKSLTETMATPLIELAGAIRHKAGASAASSEVDPALVQDMAQPKQPSRRASEGWRDSSSLTGVFDRLEASAIRQEQLLARLADILVPWTEIFPKGRLPAGNVRRPETSKAAPSQVSHHA
jgi:hypothetical protein